MKDELWYRKPWNGEEGPLFQDLEGNEVTGIYRAAIKVTEHGFSKDSSLPWESGLRGTNTNVKILIVFVLYVIKKGKAKECSNYHAIAFNSHTSKVCSKFSTLGFKSM